MTTVFTDNPSEALSDIIARINPSSVHVVTDSNVEHLAANLLPDAPRIVLTPGDEHKSLTACTRVWENLIEQGATRRSLVVNIGGGMVTDLGGFAAATFKRGVPALNVPTTLLGAVDAAIGGKTGVNFRGLKNEIGAFRQPEAVVVSALPFSTLPRRELLSGFAEMIKHGLIDGPDLLRTTLALNLSHPADMLSELRASVMVKERIVAADPTERGLRKVLNLGHTAGHAFEELLLQRNTPVPHGFAVAWGLAVELVLSRMRLDFPSEWLHAIADTVKDLYGSPAVTCKDHPALMALMAHDKKNATPGAINFTLLRRPGECEINQIVPPDEIQAALDIFADLIQ